MRLRQKVVLKLSKTSLQKKVNQINRMFRFSHRSMASSKKQQMLIRSPQLIIR